MGATRNTGYIENLIAYDGNNNIGVGGPVNVLYKVTIGGNTLVSGNLNVTGTITFSSNVTANSFVKNGGVATEFLKADGTVDSSTYATVSYVDTSISNLIDAAPAALNTLNELAAALGDDSSFSTTVTTALGNRLRIDTDAQGLTSEQKANGRTNLGVVIGTDVQAYDADLGAIAALSGTSGLLKKTAANTWTLDTNTYITGGFIGTTALQSSSATQAMTGISSIEFVGHVNDVAKIEVTTNAAITYFDFTLADDNNQEEWRWRFNPTGGTIYSAMRLVPTTNTTSNLIVSGTIAASNFSGSSSGTNTGDQDLSGYQPIDADLTAIAALSGTSGFLKKTAANSWSLDTNSYVDTINPQYISGYKTFYDGISVQPTNALTNVINFTASMVPTNANPVGANFGFTWTADQNNQTFSAVYISAASPGNAGSYTGLTTYALRVSGNSRFQGTVQSTGNITGANLSGTNTGDQTITLTGDVTGSGTGSFATTVNAYFDQRVYTRADNYLGGYYVSGGTEKPNDTIFGGGKLKVAMLAGSNLGYGGPWNDVLWISTYTGGDVKSSHALVFDKYSTDVWVSDQNFDSASWGTGYKLLHSGNYNSYSPTLTGGSASGTWDINITGNAATSTIATQLLSPNGATVVAANSAFPSTANTMIHTLALGPGDNDGHILGFSWTSTASYGAQIYIDTDPNDIMSIRSRSGAGAWTSWKTVYHSGNLTNLNQLTNGPGYITSSATISGASGALSSRDNRVISPSEDNAAQLKFGFTSWNNNDAPGWADYLHLRSYSDNSGGGDNLIMFLKNGFGMRQWQQTFGSATAYSSYVDYLHSSNYSSYALPLSGGTVTGTTNIRNLYVGDSGSSWSDPGGWGTQLHVSNGPHSIIRVYARSEAIETIMFSHVGGQSKVGSGTNHDFAIIRNYSSRMIFYSSYTYSYGSFTSEGDITAYSDIRLKENIQLITNPIEKLSKLRGVTFNRNDANDKNRRFSGVIAQEVEKVFPEVVNIDENGVYSVAYGNMVGLLIESIKEQQKQIEELKSQIKNK